MVQPKEAVVGVIGAKNTAQGWFRRQAIDSLYFIDEFDVLENSRIVERRFTAALEFNVAENEGLVFLDWTADRRAELILPQVVCAGSLQ